MSLRSSLRHHPSRGFTLLEILIAISILSVVLTTVYAAYSGTLKVISELDEDSRAYQMARITLDRMSRDLSSLQRFEDGFVLRSKKNAIGSREFGSLILWSAAHLAFEENELSGSPATVAYFVRENKGGGFSLWRSDRAGARPSPDQAETDGMIICEDLQALNLKFYDETGQEFDAWDSASVQTAQRGRPPALVQIELIMASVRDAEKPYRFTTRVFLPVRR